MSGQGKTLRLKATRHPNLEMKQLYGFTGSTKYQGAVKLAN